MRAFDYAVQIDRPPDLVWAFMMDRRYSRRWQNLVRSIESLTPGPLRVGTELLVTFDVRGQTTQVTSHVWAFDPPRRYGVGNTTRNVTGAFEYTLEATGTGTTVRFRGDIRPHGWMWLALPLLLQDGRIRYKNQLSNLKREVEDGGPP